MTVDTVRLRQAAEICARGYNVPDAQFELIHAAANELDELRETMRNRPPEMHASCAEVDEVLREERAAHGATKRELESFRTSLEHEVTMHVTLERELSALRARLKEAEVALHDCGLIAEDHGDSPIASVATVYFAKHQDAKGGSDG
jgi:multidrug resistance efflux pump